MNDAAKPFDLSVYQIDQTGTLTVMNVKRDGELIGADGVNPVTIEVYSSGSPQAVKALHRAGQALQRRMRETIQGKLDPQAAIKAEAEQVDKLVAFTKSINNFPVDPRTLYSDPSLGWIARQVDAFISDDANFSKPS